MAHYWIFVISIVIGVATGSYLIGYKRGWTVAIKALYIGMKQWDSEQTSKFADYCAERIRKNMHER